MTCYRAQGFLAVGLGLVAFGTVAACSDPELKTALRPAGDPEVLAVMVLDENYEEYATYCKPDDEKVPVVITGGYLICPDPATDDPPVDAITNAEPLSWQARVVFDELLDPDIETLEGYDADGNREPCNTTIHDNCEGHLDITQPLVLTCDGADIAYDGWYDPSGNNVTLPPGPSLVVYPLEFVATSASCTIEVKEMVKDKDGNSVPSGQRAIAGYTWDIAPLQIFGVDPADESEVATDTIFDVSFNSLIDAGSVAADEITLVDSSDAAVAFTVEADGTELLITPDAALAEGESYTLTLAAGAEFTDIGGGPITLDEAVVVTVTVPAP